jgi:hypothetical protein
MNEFRIKFHGARPPNYEKVYAQVNAELCDLYDDLEGRPERLIFHTVILSKDFDGPTVFCWGDPDEPGVFQCEYSHKTQWVTLDDKPANTSKRRTISHPRPPKGMV